jgi:hypothetical protein
MDAPVIGTAGNGPRGFNLQRALRQGRFGPHTGKFTPFHERDQTGLKFTHSGLGNIDAMQLPGNFTSGPLIALPGFSRIFHVSFNIQIQFRLFINIEAL